MKGVWLGLTILLIGLNWLAVWFHWRKTNHISKALIMVALMAWLISTTGLVGPAGWFGAGLIFSLIGDILLLLSARFFIYGLGAFLVTHLCYLAGFLSPPPPLSIAVWVFILFFLSLGTLVYGVIRAALKLNPAFRRLRRLLAVYCLAICSMSASACLTLVRADWQPQSAGLAASGALLFLFSDALLAYDRFLNPQPQARLWKRITYHLGQLAITASVALHLAHEFNRA